jgi:hypothetical protein
MRSPGEPCLHCSGGAGALDISNHRVALAIDTASSFITLSNVGAENLEILSLRLLDPNDEPTSAVEPADTATERWFSPPTQCQMILIAPDAMLTLSLRYIGQMTGANVPASEPYRLLIESNDPRSACVGD